MSAGGQVTGQYSLFVYNVGEWVTWRTNRYWLKGCEGGGGGCQVSGGSTVQEEGVSSSREKGR